MAIREYCAPKIVFRPGKLSGIWRNMLLVTGAVTLGGGGGGGGGGQEIFWSMRDFECGV